MSWARILWHNDEAEAPFLSAFFTLYDFRLTQDGAESSSDKSKDELLEQNHKDDAVSLSLDDINNASDKEEYDTYTTNGCKQTLMAKVIIF